MALRMVMLGAPGAGKGTQTRRFATAYGVPHISTGDMLRTQIREQTKIGTQVQEFIESGRLAPDDVACAMISGRLEEADCENGYILDGFPRSLEQAGFLWEYLQSRDQKLDAVVNLDVPDDEIVARLTVRRICPSCGAIYSLRSKQPRQEGVCDADSCGGVALVQRKDDSETAIRERLRVYHRMSEPVLAFYRGHNLLSNVSGSGCGPDEVFERIEECLHPEDKARPE